VVHVSEIEYGHSPALPQEGAGVQMKVFGAVLADRRVADPYPERQSGRTVARSVARDLANAGAKWEDAEMVVDGKLVTSRSPQDLPAFCKAVVEVFAAR
jgi:putative intracellular protease/amidase